MREVLPVLGWQFLATLLAGLLILAFDRTAAISVFLGGLICVIPNSYLAIRLLLKSGQGDSRAFLNAAYVGEAIKFILTAVLFAVVFIRVRPLTVPAVFAGYILCFVVQWVSLIFIGRDHIPAVGSADTEHGE